jgi:ssDNA-binding Zn-finger/Zn-ribbon topoisomerase 1
MTWSEKIWESIFKMQEDASRQKENEVICNVCGAEMIKRKSKFGNGFWWGCSNYPRCTNKFS